MQPIRAEFRLVNQFPGRGVSWADTTAPTRPCSSAPGIPTRPHKPSALRCRAQHASALASQTEQGTSPLFKRTKRTHSSPLGATRASGWWKTPLTL